MAAKKKNTESFSEIPKTLKDHPFFGLTLDDEQRSLVDAVWKREKKVYLIDSVAGTGKTLMATALGVLMVKYGLYNKVLYVTFPGIYEKAQGFLPGDLLKKSEPYFQPLYDALIKINEDPNKVCMSSQSAMEFGDPYIECAVSTYMRGININNSFVIIDEAENADLHTLAKVLSRINDSCLTMVIGHSGQCDMYDKTKSGFTSCIDYQTKFHPDTCQSFVLKENHRGDVSKWADLMLNEYKNPSYGFIYMTVNKITGDVTFGKHKRTMDMEDIDDSWCRCDERMMKMIIKYGEDNIDRKIVYECNSEEKLNYMYDLFSSFCSKKLFGVINQYILPITESDRCKIFNSLKES